MHDSVASEITPYRRRKDYGLSKEIEKERVIARLIAKGLLPRVRADWTERVVGDLRYSAPKVITHRV